MSRLTTALCTGALLLGLSLAVPSVSVAAPPGGGYVATAVAPTSYQPVYYTYGGYGYYGRGYYGGYGSYGGWGWGHRHYHGWHHYHHHHGYHR